MELNTIINSWNDELISTGEALSSILVSEDTLGNRMEAIATITYKLLEKEQADAEKHFIEAHFFNFTEHVRDYYIRDLPKDDYQEIPY